MDERIDKLALEHREIERAFNGCLSVPVLASQSSSRAGNTTGAQGRELVSVRSKSKG